ncbi:hypothetical protein Esti_003515 [Eimeria stiedai]
MSCRIPVDGPGQPSLGGPPGGPQEPPPRSEQFPFFSEAAAKELLQRCSSSAETPQFIWRPLRWRLRPGVAGSSGARRPSSSSSSDESSSSSSSICCISGVALGGVVSRGALSRVSAAATLEASPRPLVVKRYLLHSLKRLRTACFVGGDVQVLTEWERVKCELLLHASLRHPLICPLQGLIVDEAAGLLLLLLPRRPHTLQRWNSRSACFVVLKEQLQQSRRPQQQLQQQQQQQQEQQEEEHRCEAPGSCGCMRVLLYTEEGAKQLLRQLVEAVSALHALRVVHKDIKPSNVLLLRCLPASFGCFVWVPPVRPPRPGGDARETISRGDSEENSAWLGETDAEGDTSEEEGDAAADRFLFASSPCKTIPEEQLQPLTEALEAADPLPVPPVPLAAPAAAAADSFCCFAGDSQQEESRVPLAKALRRKLIERVAFERDNSSSSSSSSEEDMQQQQQQQQQQGRRGRGKRRRKVDPNSSGGSTAEEGLPAATNAAASLDGVRSSSTSSSSSSNSSSSSSSTDVTQVLLQLTDFNSAAVADDEACTIWDAAGSPHFVSPECLGTADARGTDGRARDISAPQGMQRLEETRGRYDPNAAAEAAGGVAADCASGVAEGLSWRAACSTRTCCLLPGGSSPPSAHISSGTCCTEIPASARRLLSAGAFTSGRATTTPTAAHACMLPAAASRSESETTMAPKPHWDRLPPHEASFARHRCGSVLGAARCCLSVAAQLIGVEAAAAARTAAAAAAAPAAAAAVRDAVQTAAARDASPNETRLSCLYTSLLGAACRGRLGRLATPMSTGPPARLPAEPLAAA